MPALGQSDSPAVGQVSKVAVYENAVERVIVLLASYMNIPRYDRVDDTKCICGSTSCQKSACTGGKAADYTVVQQTYAAHKDRRKAA